MIINPNNSSNILSGSMKRGFNQKPSDIVDRRIKMEREQKQLNQPHQENNSGIMNNTPQMDLRNKIDALNRMNRKMN